MNYHTQYTHYMQKAKGYDGCLFYLLIVLMLTIVGIRAKAQPFKPYTPDTVRIHDTIGVPVLLYQAFDTTAFVYLTRSNSPALKPCFVIRSGFRQNTPKGLQWIEEPKVVGIYSKRWKVIDSKKIQRIL